MRTMTTILGALLLLLTSVMTTRAQLVITEPDLASGSQLIFYYDTREGFTTFVNIRSNVATPITVQLEVWGPAFDEATKVTRTFSFAPLAVRVIDVGALKTTDGLPAQQGIAVASILNESSLPIHIRRGLFGNFTVANLATGSAWGSPAAGRSVRSVVDPMAEPADGTVVTQLGVHYQLIEPTVLTLATYYNPETLAPVEDHGNQLIFVNFNDGIGTRAPLTSASTTWGVIVTRGTEGTFLTSTVDTAGVTERDLVSVLGTEANGAAAGGGLTRGEGSVNANRFVFFVQSLGTFGMGYLLPSLD